MVRALLLVALAAITCNAQPIRTVCVLPSLTDPTARQRIEQWLNRQGIETSDCIAHPGEGDAVIDYYVQHSGVIDPTYSVYRLGNRITVQQDEWQAQGITIWLQSHREGEVIAGQFVGRMLYWGQAANLEDGLKKIRRRIQQANRIK